VSFQLKTTEKIVKLLHNALRKKSLVVLIGDRGSFLTAIDNEKIQGSIFIPHDEQLDTTKYKFFINKYRKFQVFFLLDHSNCSFRHEAVPIIAAVVNINHIENFIAKHYDKEEIVAYNIHGVTEINSEVWNTIMASARLEPPISTVLDYMLSESLQFSGVYFLSLEFRPIIDNILNKTGNNIHKDDLQILVVPTRSSGIKIVSKHKSNILSIKNVDYPFDKSDMYVQGTIEQEVNDQLILLKSYINKEALKVCIIILAEGNLKVILKETTFAEHKIILLSASNLSSSQNQNTNLLDLSDSVIAKLFIIEKSYLGLNQQINTITQLNIFSLIIFKPLMLVVLTLLGILGYYEFQILQNHRKAFALSEEYYRISEEYRALREKYPNIQNVTNIADLYSMDSLINLKAPEPFDLLDKIFSSLNPKMELVKLKWDLLSQDSSAASNKTIRMNLIIKVTESDDGGKDKLYAEIDKYVDQLQKQLSNYKVAYKSHKDEIIFVLDSYIISIEIEIVGPRESQSA
jgi:hypothetical protein